MSCFVEGDPSAPICVVAMAPGRDELKEDRPLIGGSGRLLWSMAARRGKFLRQDCYLLNVIGEWPEGATGAPSAEQLERWWDRFNENLAQSRATLMLLLGGDALRRVMGNVGGIEQWRGYVMTKADAIHGLRRKKVQSVYKTSNKARGIKKGDLKWETVKTQELAPIPPTVAHIIPTLHPAAVLRSGLGPLPAFAADIARAGRALRGELRPYRTTFASVPTAVAPGTPVVFDIETPRDQGHRRVIERIAVATDAGCWTAPWNGHSKDMTIHTLSGGSASVAHNIAFDAPHLEAHGVRVPEPWFDTMLAAAMLEPDLYKGLNPVSALYLDRPRWKHLSEEQPEYYNAQDANATLELYDALRDKLAHNGQLELFEKTIMPTIPVLVDMTQTGIPLDSGRRSAWVDRLAARRVELHAAWSGYAGDVSPQSPHQLKRLLYEQLGMNPQYGKYGGETVDAASIKMLLGDPQNAPHKETLLTLLEYRQTSKLLKTYAEVPISDDGRVHPSWLPASKDDDGFGKGLAGTWRITSHEPNFQNQPAEARLLYIPPPGWCFIEADWSQIEARIIAALSGDEALAAAIKKGLHTTNMELIGVDKTRAKNGFYGWCYGAGKRTLRRTFLAHGFDVSEAECGALLRRFEEVYPKVTAWRKGIQDELRATYSLRNPFGLRRHFYRGADDAPAGFDYLPQSSAAMCMWTVIRPLHDALRRLYGGAIFALVHDSFLIGVPEDAAVAAASTLKEHMERPFDAIAPGFVVPAEVSVGEPGASWGELKQ